MKIKISDFGVVRSPERFSHSPSTQADWTEPPHGSSGCLFRDNITYFHTKLFLLRKSRKCISGNRDLGAQTTHVGVRSSPPECWDRGKTAQAIARHQILKF